MDLLERLRNKPPAQRNMFALGTALVITGVIAGVWFTTHSALKANAPFEASASEAEVDADGPLATIEEGFGRFMEEASGVFEMIGRQLEGSESFDNVNVEEEAGG